MECRVECWRRGPRVVRGRKVYGESVAGCACFQCIYQKSLLTWASGSGLQTGYHYLRRFQPPLTRRAMRSTSVPRMGWGACGDLQSRVCIVVNFSPTPPAAPSPAVDLLYDEFDLNAAPLNLPQLPQETVEQWRREATDRKIEKARRAKARKWQARRPRSSPTGDRACRQQGQGEHVGSSPTTTIVGHNSLTPHFQIEEFLEVNEGVVRFTLQLEKIVRGIASNYGFNTPDNTPDSPELEDMRAEAIGKLWEALRRFDPTRQSVFEFAAREVRTGCVDWLRQQRFVVRTRDLERWAHDAGHDPGPRATTLRDLHVYRERLQRVVPEGWKPPRPTAEVPVDAVPLASGVSGDLDYHVGDLRRDLVTLWPTLRDDERLLLTLSEQHDPENDHPMTDEQIGVIMDRPTRGVEGLRRRTKRKVMAILYGDS